MQGIEQAKKQAAEEIWLSYFNEQAYAEQDSGGTGAIQSKKTGQIVALFFVYIYRCNRR